MALEQTSAPASPPVPAPTRPAHWPAALGFVALALAITFPAVLRLGTHIVGMNDAQVFVWELWWFHRALFTLHVDPLHTDMLFYPAKALPLIWSTPANLWPGIPLTGLVGPVAAYNVLVLAGVAIAGYAAYRLAFRITQRRDAAFIAGALFTLAPAHTAQIVGGHLGVMSIQWVPVAILALWRLREAPTVGRALAFALALALVLVSDLYVALYFLGTLGLVGAAWAVRHYRELPGRFWGLGVLGGAVAGLAALPAHWPTFRTLSGAVTTDVQAQTVHRFGQDLVQLLLPAPSHPLFGELSAGVAARVTNSDSWGTLGLTAIALSALALWRCRSAVTRFWGAVASVAIVGSLGTHLNALGPTGLPLPYALLTSLPVVKSLRVPSRLAEVTALALAMLAAVGAAWLLRRLGPRATWGFAGLVALVFLEDVTHAPFPTTSAAAPAYYQAIAADANAGAILDLPNGDGNWGGPTHRWMVLQTVHQRPIVMAHTHRIPDGAMNYSYSSPLLWALCHSWEGLPATLSIAEARKEALALRRDGITHVIMHRVPVIYDGAGYAHARGQLVAVFGAPAYEDAEMTVFLTPGPPVAAGSGR